MTKILTRWKFWNVVCDSDEHARAFDVFTSSHVQTYQYVRMQKHQIRSHLGWNLDAVATEFLVHPEQHVVCVPIVACKIDYHAASTHAQQRAFFILPKPHKVKPPSTDHTSQYKQNIVMWLEYIRMSKLFNLPHTFPHSAMTGICKSILFQDWERKLSPEYILTLNTIRTKTKQSTWTIRLDILHLTTYLQHDSK